MSDLKNEEDSDYLNSKQPSQKKMIGEKQKQLKRIFRSGANLEEGRISFEPTLEFARISADGELEASESGFDFDEIEF